MTGPKRHTQRIVRCLRHWRKHRSLSNALCDALDASRQASSWPGERLAVSLEMAEHVERVIHDIQFEARVYDRARAARDRSS